MCMNQRTVHQTIDNKENLKFIIYYNSMDYELELKIDALEKENKQLKAQVEFLKEQLTYKTFGKPLNLEEDEWVETQD